MSPPAKYQEGFLEKMDLRTTLYNNLNTSYKQVVRDLGGAGNLSRLELSLIERFVYCELLIRKTELEMANSDNGSQKKFLMKWVRLNNAINSIIAKLGISKRKTQESDLAKYLEEREE
jgi:hypothetical protein